MSAGCALKGFVGTTTCQGKAVQQAARLQFANVHALCRSIRQGTSILKLGANDALCYAAKVRNDDAVIVACSQGKVATFAANQVTIQGRNAGGIIGKKVNKGALSCVLSQLSLSGKVACGRVVHGLRVP